ncbi:SPOR domain-containing protein [Sedimenticola sp.]|uniref:SPOR domain-containing protein n=1 Tax=Sedimenticola sp. TaxID=1940285 RepID=UPI003D0A8CF7
MDEGLKKRLVGATVLVSLVVIFVPMLLEDEPVIETGIYKTNIPPKPERDFSSRVVPAEDEKLSVPPASHRQEIVPLKPPPAPAVTAKTESSPQPADSGTAESKPTPVEPRVGLTAWVIQVGSFSSRENAEKLVQQIREMKYAAFMEQAEVDGKTLFRVKVGPEVDRKLADKMLLSLNKDLKSLNLKGKVISYP